MPDIPMIDGVSGTTGDQYSYITKNDNMSKKYYMLSDFNKTAKNAKLQDGDGIG